MKRKKRHFLLLEVMIAFGLVVMCVVPMLAPHLYMLTEERRFIREVELDRLVSVLYCNLLIDGFYKQTIPWRIIEGSEPISIDDDAVKNLGFKGTYAFEVDKSKGKLAQDIDALNLLTVTYTFNPVEGGDPLVYAYDLFVVRVPPGTRTQSAGESQQ